MAKAKSKPKIKYYLFEDDRIIDESDSLGSFVNQMVTQDTEHNPFRVIKGYELLVFPDEEPVEIQYYVRDI
jgi:hypothetical protein